MPEILDQFGQPYPETPPDRPTAEAQTAAGREQVYPAVSRGVTPARLAQILDQGAEGDPSDFFTMCEEMEETDLHYYSILGTRKLAVTGSPRHMEPADSSDRAAFVAEQARIHVSGKPEFAGMLYDMLDGLGKGLAPIQPVWDTSTRPWTYREYIWTDPRWLVWNPTDLSQPLLKTEANPDGVVPPAGTFVVHVPKLKSGLALRSGFGRMAAIVYMLKKYTLKDWMAFMEVFGMPTRIGKYDPATTTDREKRTLLNALRNLGHDAAAMIPHDMEIEIEAVNRGSGGDSLFGGLADYLDKQVSKGILGQTMTSENGGSLAQAKVHQQVRQDILDADAEQLAATVNAHIIAPWVRYNFGDRAPMPRLVIDTRPPEDLTQFTQAALPWVERAGLQVSATWVRERLGIPEIEDGDGDILGETLVEEPDESGAPSSAGGDPGEDQAVAENATVPAPLRRTETRPEVMATQWERVLGPHRDVLEEIAERSEGYEDFLEQLNNAESQFDSNMFVRRLALEMAKVRGLANA